MIVLKRLKKIEEMESNIISRYLSFKVAFQKNNNMNQNKLSHQSTVNIVNLA